MFAILHVQVCMPMCRNTHAQMSEVASQSLHSICLHFSFETGSLTEPGAQ